MIAQILITKFISYLIQVMALEHAFSVFINHVVGFQVLRVVLGRAGYIDPSSGS